MPIFTRDERAVLFVHIPKAGGTSIERMLMAAGWDVGFRATPKTHPAQSRLHRVSPQHYHAELLEQTLRLDRFDVVFTVTREPLQRFRSEYTMRNRKKDGAGSRAHFEQWSRSVLRRVRSDPNVLDNHLRPQHEFLLPRARVFRLEDGMESIVRSLNESCDLGLPSEIPRHLGSGAGGEISSGDVEDSAVVEATVREFYASDYELLGYA